MADVIPWLQNRVGFNLPAAEVQSILHFALLCSLFEAKALEEDGRPPKIIEAVEQWEADGRLQLEPFQTSLDYFKDRYFPAGQESPRFAALDVNDAHRARLATVLSGANANPREAVIAVLLVVNRLRNNLMHGLKWEYLLAGHGDNFYHANMALMAALDCNRMSA